MSTFVSFTELKAAYLGQPASDEAKQALQQMQLRVKPAAMPLLLGIIPGHEGISGLVLKTETEEPKKTTNIIT